jgi:hypothetical protein
MDFGIFEVLIAAVVVIGGCWLWDWVKTMSRGSEDQK